MCKAGDGHFEKVPNTRSQWRVQHATCAIKFRGMSDMEIFEILEADKSTEQKPKGAP